MRLLLAVSVLSLASYTRQFSYKGYKVYRLQPLTDHHLDLLSTMEQNIEVDIWTRLTVDSTYADIMVSPSVQPLFKNFTRQNKINFITHIENVESHVKKERKLQEKATRKFSKRINFQKFYRYEKIRSYLKGLSKKYPDLVTVQSIGKSYEKRLMDLIKISTDPNANKSIIFIDAGIHAREWISIAMAQYIVNQLVENTTNSNLLEQVDWHILPVMNPDGYEYSHTNQRYWRKTRSRNQLCYGVDGNRNFGFHWGGEGTSSNPCSDIFKGPEAFSEKETQNVRDYITSLGNRVKLYLTFHSYGGYILYPWGFTSELPHDEPKLRSLAKRVNDAIVDLGGGKPFTIGTSANALYPSAGGSDDWVKGVIGVELSYTIELHGNDFVVPPKHITRIVKETFYGVIEYGKYIAEEYGQKY